MRSIWEIPGKVLNLFCLGLAVLWSALCALFSLPLYWIKEDYGQRTHTLFGKGWLAIMGIKLEVINPQNLPKMGVLAPNHESMFDIPVLSSLPTHFRWISKKEVKRIPFIGWSMQAMGCYFVARDRSGKDLNILKAVEDDLRLGNCVLIFPEGTRTRTGALLPFKKGAFKTAQNAGVPLVPIAITGTRSIAPPGKLPSRKHRVLVRVGNPIIISPGESLDKVMESFRATLTELLKENRLALNAGPPGA